MSPLYYGRVSAAETAIDALEARQDVRAANTTPHAISNVGSTTTASTCLVDITSTSAGDRIAHVRVKVSSVTIAGGDGGTLQICLGPASTALVTAGALTSGVVSVADIALVTGTTYDVELTIDLTSTSALDVRGWISASSAALAQAVQVRGSSVSTTGGLRIGVVLDPNTTWGASSTVTVSAVTADHLKN